jgi:ubiquitin C-terminal hydrolase
MGIVGLQGDSSAVNPSNLKRIISQDGHHFAGNYQQDSHELLEYILDKLHEDQNRVIKKPTVAVADSEGLSDNELAEEAWSNHRQRDDSFIVDHCQVP